MKNTTDPIRDNTEYCISIGYQRGQKPVLVQAGKVISHRNQDWFVFCDKIRHPK